MSILKWKNFDELLSIKDEVDRMFDKMFEAESFNSWEERYALMTSGVQTPQFRMYERNTDVVIQANMPGFEKGDIKVSVSGNLLAIGSEVGREREFRGNNAYRYQRSQGSFCKITELPSGLDTSSITTSFNNGVLEIVIPKAVNRITDRTDVQAKIKTGSSTLPSIVETDLPDMTDQNK